MTDKEDTLGVELDKRLDDLFDEDSLENPESFLASQPDPKPREKKDIPRSHPERQGEEPQPGGETLRGLNALLLSMEWEIDDSVMAQYLTEIKRLQKAAQDDKALLNFFRLLESVSLYLKRNKVHAHQDTLRILQEIQSGAGLFLDLQPTLSDNEKKNYFNQAYERFKAFKEQIAGKKSTDKMPAPRNRELVNLIRSIVRKELESFRKDLLDEIHRTQNS
ncbi:hypothetical protein OOT00_14190 [Desulfobotulus sp. H1]|uniref:Uncharacterized protein n=1 Tax=Desulfobotulus pelophilus TaxID=2823377 RepID=A0ABT3NCF5_9BACT|nr:hypothetical protein [Desulfobotulus pelophilus]MCW7755134.1 hypothetical protein [Desulfobotulus pelophilus]